MKKLSILIILFGLITTLFSCKNEKPDNQKKIEQPTIARPDFNQDSAYYFVQKQVDFGPRVPGTMEHQKAADWLLKKLASYTDTAQVQKASATMYNGTKIPINNIIGSINLDNPNRVLLAAHWDSRHIADKDGNPMLQNKAILGANDGASGVAVLLEIARQLQIKDSKLGIDIIFFDAEDLGSPLPTSIEEDDWCLGSQYWSKNPHVPNYKADYGILLDMVGADDASFKFERRAYKNAAPIYQKTWNIGQNLGYNYLFINELGGDITDDHIYVMINRQFPMIDILDFDQNRGGFGSYHHTHQDNMDIISKNTLGAVGETVIATLEN